MSMTFAQRLTTRSMLYAGLLALATSTVPAVASAQAKQGSGRSSRVSTSVPAVAVMRRVSAPQVQSRRDGRVELVAGVTVAANTDYRVAVRPSGALPAGLRIWVRNADGVYVRLGTAAVSVARGTKGTTQNVIAFRVEGAAHALRPSDLGVSYTVEREGE